MTAADPDYEQMLRRENDSLKSENTLMKERLDVLKRQL